MATAFEPVAVAAGGHQKVAITNVRVFDGQGLTEPRTVVICDGLISDDAEDAVFVDGAGGTLLPGLIDAHIHLQDEKDLHQLARFGVTTGLDMAHWPHDHLQSLRGIAGTTDIRSPGLPATTAGSLHSCVLPFSKDDLVASLQDAAQFVADRVSEGADYIKVISDVPGPGQEMLNALVSAAHGHNKLVVAHASSFKPYNMAQEAKADIITHVPADKPLDQQSVTRMLSEKRVAVPTLVMMEGVLKPPSWAALFMILLRPRALWAIVQSRRANAGERKYENARASVTAMYQAGVPILAGTDANSAAGSPFQCVHGDSLHREMELLIGAGLSNVDVLRAATSLPAQHFGLNDRGAIEVGKRADLVLIEGDPTLDIRATRSLKRVWCGGVEVSLSPS